jgi:hypothetical protein
MERKIIFEWVYVWLFVNWFEVEQPHSWLLLLHGKCMQGGIEILVGKFNR